MVSSAPSALANPANVVFFLVTAAVFMHFAARTTVKDVDWYRAPATVLVLFLTAVAVSFASLPPVVSVLVLVTVALITVQSIYQISMKKSVIVLVAYMVLTTVVGVLLQGIIGLI
ncbi:MAG: hypothetical protein ABEK59_00735 [Halobacteria archaeon]